MSNDKIITKIRKLLALAQSGNENEAALAAAKANELMAEHEFSSTDLIYHEIQEKQFDTGKSAMPQWKLSLANFIASAYDCRITYSSGYCFDKGTPNEIRSNAKINLIGPELDVEVALYVYEFCFKTVERMTKEYMKRTKGSDSGARVKERNSYQLGLARSLGKKVDDFADENRVKNETKVNQEGVTGKDLIVIKQDAVNKYCDSLSLRKGSGSSQTLSSEGYNQGQQDGKGVHIRNAVNGKSGGQLT